MKPLELTEEHKTKLLEMCKELFPKDNIKQIDRFNRVIVLSCLQKIHWFEFCMTHLAEKLLNPKDLNNKVIKTKFERFFMEMNSYSWFIQDPGMRESFTSHPVDYLYKQFKLIKQ